jgi:L-arabinokinase
LPAVFFYISGHGFGHASRQIEIINALGRLSPDTRIVIRSSAARWLFDRTVRVPFTLIDGEVDTGVVQIDSLHLEEQETVRRAVAFYDTLDERAAAEASRLRADHARLVVSDAPPLGCAAAFAAGVPSVVCSNFTWDWIYAGYDEARRAPELLRRISETYRLAAAGWRLPMHGGFESIAPIIDVPFVARHAAHPAEAVRRALGLSADRPLVLASFGGYGLESLALDRLDCVDLCDVIVTGRDPRVGSIPGVTFLHEARLYDAGFHYEDLVAAVDVIATKPGYGIIAECVANDTAMLYTSRGHFVEYDVLVREMPRYLRCRFIEQDDLLNGRWRAAIEALLASPPAPERPRTDGADVVAHMIQGLL